MRKSDLFQHILQTTILINLALVFGLIYSGVGLSLQDFLTLISADLLGLLVILAVLPVEKEPDMKITEAHSWTKTIKHPKGDFRIRFFEVGVVNKHGIFTKVADAVKPSVVFPSLPQAGREEVWWEHERPKLSMDAKVDPSNPEEVSKALEQSGFFEAHKLDFDPADSYVAVFAFGLSTTRHIYLASNPPMRIDADTPDPNNKGWLVRVPIGFVISSPTLSVPPNPKLLNLIGNSWENAEAVFLRLKRTEKVSGGEYAHHFEVESADESG